MNTKMALTLLARVFFLGMSWLSAAAFAQEISEDETVNECDLLIDEGAGETYPPYCATEDLSQVDPQFVRTFYTDLLTGRYFSFRLDLADMDRLFVPFTFSAAKPSLIESRLAQIVTGIEKWCGYSGATATSEPACLFPRVVAEFREVGARLKTDSFDGKNLSLTLAARLHPIDLMRMYEGGEGFDSLYARFLISQRLMREIWPYVVKASAGMHLPLSDMDDWLVPWAGARTPWSFLLNLAKGYSCVAGSDCGSKQEIVGLLQKVSSVIAADPQYELLLKSFQENSKPPFKDDRTALLYADLLKVMAGESAGRLLMLPTSMELSQLNVSSAEDYLDHVQAEAAVPTGNLPAFTGDACGDIALSLAAMKTDPSTQKWAANVRPNLQCSQGALGVPYMDGFALTDLRVENKLWRFNFFQLRLLILSLFNSMRALPPAQVELFQLHEVFADIESVRTEIAKFGEVPLKYEKEYRGQMRFLYHYLLGAQDRAAEIMRSEGN